MEVTHKFQSLLLVPFIFTLISCNDTDKGTEKFSNAINKDQCVASARTNEYVIQYKDGSLKTVYAETQEELLQKYIQPEIENIDVVDRNIIFNDNHLSTQMEESAMAPESWGQTDIQAEAAWQAGFFGQNVGVAVVDSGVNFKHPSLAQQIVTNEGEFGVDENGKDKSTNGIDDDGNGYVDDSQGYNFASNVPGNIEDSGHGTHVAGIIASSHTSVFGKVVYGIAPQAKIIPIDFIDAESGGTIQAAARSIDYVIKMKDQFNIKVVNASWGGTFCSTILEKKILDLQNNNILLVAAAGNENLNIDYNRQYPASYALDNIISVGAISPFLLMTYFTNYGDEGVDLFAPGEQIYSTIKSADFARQDGTSMAAPFVSGAAAVLWSKKPSAYFTEIKNAILNHGDYSSNYRSKSKSKLNIAEALNNL